VNRCRRCADAEDLCLSCASACLGVSRASMTRMLKTRAIAFYSYPYGGRRIAVADLEAFKARCRKSPRVSHAILAAPQRLRAVDTEVSKRNALKALGRNR